jgi:GNAT superfamily N-acetyltransferase
MNYTTLNKNNETAVREIMEYSFPENERPPFEYIKNSWDSGELNVIVAECEEKVKGFAITVCHKDMVLVLFLAVAKEYRGKGVGSDIVDQITRAYKGRRIFLEMEEPVEGHSEYELRKKRENFYVRNGFRLENYKYNAYGESFVMLCHNCRVHFEEYKDLLNECFGKKVTEERINPYLIEDAV